MASLIITTTIKIVLFLFLFLSGVPAWRLNYNGSQVYRITEGFSPVLLYSAPYTTESCFVSSGHSAREQAIE